VFDCVTATPRRNELNQVHVSSLRRAHRGTPLVTGRRGMSAARRRRTRSPAGKCPSAPVLTVPARRRRHSATVSGTCAGAWHVTLRPAAAGMPTCRALELRRHPCPRGRGAPLSVRPVRRRFPAAASRGGVACSDLPARTRAIALRLDRHNVMPRDYEPFGRRYAFALGEPATTHRGAWFPSDVRRLSSTVSPQLSPTSTTRPSPRAHPLSQCEE
jgi:hypothetical protein